MEHSQLSQMVNWLDKEHQRDRAELNQLEQRVETLTEEKQEQANRIAELEAELAALHAQVDRVTQIEGYFERFKQEMNALQERSEARRKQALRDTDRVRQVEIDNVTQAMSGVRQEVEKLRRHDEELAAHRADLQRTSEAIARLQQQILDNSKSQDERVRSVAYLEEQRQQDNKRMAQLQAQTTELFKKMELHLSMIQQLEQLTPRLSELRSTIEELRQQQNKEIERAQFQDAQRERQIKNWLQEAELQRQRMDEYGQNQERYAEQYHRIKKAMEDLQEFEEQVQRQQHEAAELQRLAENRQRSQLEEWQSQDEQRWKKHTMEWDYQWSEYDRVLANLTERITVLEKQAESNGRRLQTLLQMAEDDAQMRAMAARDWQARFEELVDQE
jgi:epidermal growth factor receptor substrate 15